MIGFKLSKAKALFFDSSKVQRGVDRATRRVFSKFGAFTRRRARQSIRRRKKVSAPGKPPSAHGPLLKKILFYYDFNEKSLVVGPVRLGGKIGNAPEALEYGGRSKVLTGRGQARRIRSMHVQARPFMRPAFEAERPKLKGMWANSVKP